MRFIAATAFLPGGRALRARPRRATLGEEKVLVVKPATYMNESGRAVAQAMRFYKLAPADIVVIYDELDLPPGKLG